MRKHRLCGLVFKWFTFLSFPCLSCPHEAHSSDFHSCLSKALLLRCFSDYCFLLSPFHFNSNRTFGWRLKNIKRNSIVIGTSMDAQAIIQTRSRSMCGVSSMSSFFPSLQCPPNTCAVSRFFVLAPLSQRACASVSRMRTNSSSSVSAISHDHSQRLSPAVSWWKEAQLSRTQWEIALS